MTHGHGNVFFWPDLTASGHVILILELAKHWGMGRDNNFMDTQ